MSRRHHGSRPHRSGNAPRPADQVRSSLDAPAPASASAAEDRRRPIRPVTPAEALPGSEAPARPSDRAPVIDPVDHPAAQAHPEPASPRDPVDAPIPPVNGHAPGGDQAAGPVAACTAPQLRRFIKSRPYVPMHELRRRFGINGREDDVSAIDVGERRIFVGLPDREGSLLGELLRGGDIGYELSLDPRTPIVIGLYPMRPVARS
jgi:hypothetical protein